MLVTHLSHKEVSIKHRVNTTLVGRLVKVFKSDPYLVERMKSEKKEKEDRLKCIASTAKFLVHLDGFIRKMSQV